MGITFYDPYQQQRSSENMWQNLMGNMILQKISQNFKEKEFAIQREQHEQDQLRALQAEGWTETPGFPDTGPTKEGEAPAKPQQSLSIGGKTLYQPKEPTVRQLPGGLTAVWTGGKWEVKAGKDASGGELSMDKLYAAHVVQRVQSGVPLDQALAETAELKKTETTQFAGTDEAGNPIYVRTGPQGGSPFFGATGAAPPQGTVTPKGAGPVPSEQSDAIEKLNTLRTDFNVVKDTWTNNYSTAKDWVGPVDAAKAWLMEKTPYANADRAYFHSNVEGLKNQLVYLRSGKQINEQEYQRLMKELMNVTDREEVFGAKMKKFDNELSSIINTKSKMIEAGKYRGAEKVQEVIKGSKTGTAKVNPAYQRKVQEYLKQGISPDRIRNDLIQKGENPALYGL